MTQLNKFFVEHPDVTQTQIAAAVNISQQQISELALGTSNASLDTARRLQKYLRKAYQFELDVLALLENRK